jgi:hypothetical protein
MLAVSAPTGMFAEHTTSGSKAGSVLSGRGRTCIRTAQVRPPAPVTEIDGQSAPTGTIARVTIPEAETDRGAARE